MRVPPTPATFTSRQRFKDDIPDSLADEKPAEELQPDSEKERLQDLLRGMMSQ
jgi:hypothetical protein